MKVFSAATVLVVSLLVTALEAGKIERNSFKPPFKEFDIEGNRMIRDWTYGGNAVVNQNFVRLTPDRAVGMIL